MGKDQSVGGSHLRPAGIAHHFNNLLSVVRLSNDSLRRGVRGRPDLEEETVAIEKAVQQGKGVVQAVLGCSRKDDHTGLTWGRSAVRTYDTTTRSLGEMRGASVAFGVEEKSEKI